MMALILSNSLIGSRVSSGGGPTPNFNIHESWVTAPDVPVSGFVGEGGMTWTAHPGNTSNDGLVYHSKEGVTNATTTEVYLSDHIPSSADYQVFSIFGTQALIGVGMLFRYDPVSLNGYGIRMSNTTTLQLLRYDAGVSTIIGTWTVAAVSTRYLLAVSLVGSSIVVFYNGSNPGSITDATHSAAGRIGVRLVPNDGTVLMAIWPRIYKGSTVNHQLPHANVRAFGWDSTASTWIKGVSCGKSIKFNFSGEYCALRLGSTAGISGYIFVSINGEAWKRYQNVGAALPVPIYLNIGDTSTKSVRVVIAGNSRLVDNWTTPINGVTITSISTAASDVLTAPPLRAGGKMVAIGDSITRAGALNTTYAFGNAVKGWPWLVADALDMELDVIAYSSQGYETAGSGNVPAAKTALGFHSNGRASASDSTVTLVTIAHGTNDGGVLAATVMASAQTTWNTARTLYPNAKIAVILPLGYTVNPETPSAIGYRDTMNAAIAAQFAAWADGNSRLISLTGQIYGNSMTGPNPPAVSNTYTADGIHPNEYCNTLMAPDIIAGIA